MGSRVASRGLFRILTSFRLFALTFTRNPRIAYGVAPIGGAAFALHPSLPVRDAKALIALAKSRPGELNYSTAGRGTVGHLAAELLKSVAKIDIVAIHYKGTGASMIDLVAGQVQMQFPSMPAAVPHASSGKLRMIAQTGSNARRPRVTCPPWWNRD